MTITEIKVLVKKYAEKRDKVAGIVRQIEEIKNNIRQQYHIQLKLAVEAAAEEKKNLQNALDEHPDLFQKPKSLVSDGIKFGYKKQKGKVEILDESKTIELIRSKMPDTAETLIKTQESVIKKALDNLTGTELKMIGVSNSETGDVAFIAPIGENIDKLVDELLKDDEKTK